MKTYLGVVDTSGKINRDVTDSNGLPVKIMSVQRVLAFSTTTPLGANAVYTSPTIDGINYKTITFYVTSDQAGSYFFQISDDGVTWYNSSATAFTIAANAITASSFTIYLRYYRIVYTNGATPQTNFKFGTYNVPL